MKIDNPQWHKMPNISPIVSLNTVFTVPTVYHTNLLEYLFSTLRHFFRARRLATCIQEELATLPDAISRANQKQVLLGSYIGMLSALSALLMSLN